LEALDHHLRRAGGYSARRARQGREVQRVLIVDVHRSFVGVGRSDQLEPRVVSEYILELALEPGE
jgi:hypothetical protein